MRNAMLRLSLVAMLLATAILPALAYSRTVVFRGQDMNGRNASLRLVLQPDGGRGYVVNGTLFDRRGVQYAVRGFYSPSRNMLRCDVMDFRNDGMRFGQLTGFVRGDMMMARLPISGRHGSYVVSFEMDGARFR